MEGINILLTSVGRRSYLVEYFKEALSGDGMVHAANSSSVSTAFLVADKSVVTPLIYDEEYIPFLLKYCEQHQIKAIIPLFDIDLLVLAKHKELFSNSGIRVIVSDQDFVQICNDKWHTYIFLEKYGFKTPRTFLNIEECIDAINTKIISFPVIVKPRWGMGSISVFTASNDVELKVFYEKVKREIFDSYLKYESTSDAQNCVILQEKLNGQEYGLDVINDLAGKHITTICKKKCAMRSGETDVAITVDSKLLKLLGKELSHKTKHISNLDVDVFVVDNEAYILEMNARFGGGYPFSHIAGVNLPKAIVQWIKNEKAENELFEETFDVFAQKDLCLRVLEKYRISPVYSENKIYRYLTDFEKLLPISLTDRNIDILTVAKKIYTFGHMFVLTDTDNTVVGVCSFYCNNVNIKQAYINFFAIDTKHHRKGYGKALLKCVKNFIIEKEFDSILLETNRNNFNAISFYEKQGFKIVKNELDSVYMLMKR